MNNGHFILCAIQVKVKKVKLLLTPVLRPNHVT